MSITEERLIELEGKVEALVDVLSGRQVDNADGEKIKRFIDNYAVVTGLIENEGIDKFITSLVEVKSRFDQIAGRMDGLLGAIDAESDKLVKGLGGGSSGVALNVADMIMFQVSVADGYKAMLQHLRDIDITGKINTMEASLREALGLINTMRAQKEQINVLLQRVADDETIIEDIKEVNDTQQELIQNTENMIAQVEKEIENYAFYAEEFDKIYTTASNFVARFRDLVAELERVSSRDARLESLMADVMSVTFTSATEFERLTGELSQSINSLAADTAQKLEDMMLFVNEYNAVGLALRGIKDDMVAVKAECSDKASVVANTQFGL